MNNRRIKRTPHMLFSILALALLSSLQSTAQSYFVNTTLLNVREEPNTSSKVVTALPYLTWVEIDSEQEDYNDEILEIDGKLFYGRWLKIKNINDDEGLLRNNSMQNSNKVGYLFDAFLSDDYYDKDAIQYEVITKKEYNRLKSRAPQPISAPKNITNPHKIIELLSDQIMNPKIMSYDEKYDEGYIDYSAIKLSAGQILHNAAKDESAITAYIPEENIIKITGGHEMDYFVNIETGAHSELLGDPSIADISPNKQYRVNGYYNGQGPEWFLEKKVNETYKLVTTIPLYFYDYTWLDNNTLIMSKWEDYGNEYKYIKAKILK